MAAARFQRYVWPAYVAVLLATAGSTLVVEVGAHAFGGHRHGDNGTESTLAAVDCPRVGATVEVTISKQGFDSKGVTAKACDLLVVHNRSEEAFELAFGPHDHHLAYPGFAEQTIAPGQTAQGVLKAKGTFELHDHLNDDLQSQLTVR